MKINLHKISKLIASILICQGAGLLGSIFTTPNIAGWYQTLQKPALTPPNWIFGPVWISLYTMMGIAVFLIWQHGLKNKQTKTALRAFVLQLALNTTWSIVFFGFQSPALGLITILFLWSSILITILFFRKISLTATWLMIPYLLWVSFATYLNYSIWILN